MAQAARPQQGKPTGAKPGATPTAAKPTTAVDIYRPQPVKTIAALLEKQLPAIQAVLAKTIDPRRFTRLFLTLLQKKSELRECTAHSLLATFMDAAQLGLELDPHLGHAYPVPFKGQCQLIVGYRGYIHMLHQSGRVRSVYARPVYEGDVFDMVQGTEERIHHVAKEPVPGAPRRLIGCYSVIQLTDGTASFEWMWKQEIDAIRERSKASGSGPWVTDYVEMGKKTVIRRHSKTSDVSPKITRLASREEARDLGESLDLGLTDDDLAGQRTEGTAEELAKKYAGAVDVTPATGPVQGGAGGASSAKQTWTPILDGHGNGCHVRKVKGPFEPLQILECTCAKSADIVVPGPAGAREPGAEG